jgi:hypothetical protein
MQHGPAASSGSKTKAPGLSEGYFICLRIGYSLLGSELSLFFFSGIRLTMTITDTFSIARATALNIYADLERKLAWISTERN